MLKIKELIHPIQHVDFEGVEHDSIFFMNDLDMLYMTQESLSADAAKHGLSLRFENTENGYKITTSKMKLATGYNQQDLIDALKQSGGLSASEMRKLMPTESHNEIIESLLSAGIIEKKTYSEGRGRPRLYYVLAENNYNERLANTVQTVSATTAIEMPPTEEPYINRFLKKS